MLDSNQTANFLNPDTYLNHISPAEGLEYRIGNNFTMILLGAAVWDALTYLTVDASIVRGSRVSCNIFCFIFSRLLALGLVFFSAARFPTGHIPPKLLYIIPGCVCGLSLMMSSFLLLQRVLAIYHENCRVKHCFSFLWAIFSLSDIVIPFSGRPRAIPGTKIIRDYGLNPWLVACVWCSFSFDTAVTLAISYRMWLSHRLPNENSSWYHWVSGRTLPQLPRLIFRGGLQYYLIIMWWVLVSGITVCIPSVAQNYKTIFPLVTIFLMASMASRVFRNVKLFDSDSLFTDATPICD